jgi:general secretion pathway protein H
VTVRLDQESVGNVRLSATGFTLLELLAVLLILALVAAIVVPSLGGGASVELKSATRSLAAGLRQTRNQALNDNRPAVLELDVVKHEFQLPGDRQVRKLPERIDIVLFTARSEQLNEQRGAIRFFPDGSSTGGRITLSTDSMRNLVNVDWLTGRVSVIESVVEEAMGR